MRYSSALDKPHLRRKKKKHFVFINSHQNCTEEMCVQQVTDQRSLLRTQERFPPTHSPYRIEVWGSGFSSALPRFSSHFTSADSVPEQFSLRHSLKGDNLSTKLFSLCLPLPFMALLDAVNRALFLRLSSISRKVPRKQQSVTLHRLIHTPGGRVHHPWELHKLCREREERSHQTSWCCQASSSNIPLHCIVNSNKYGLLDRQLLQTGGVLYWISLCSF